MKNLITSLKRNFSQSVIFITFLLNIPLSNAQFNVRHGINASYHDLEGSDMVTCLSINEDYDYVAIHSSTTSPNEKMEAVLVKDDGTIFSNLYRYLDDNGDNFHFQPMKIIPLNDESGYAIVGYMFDRTVAPVFNPFVMITDDLLDPTGLDFKRFDMEGYFCDVDQLPNDDFLFCGSTNSNYSVTATSMSGLIVKTDASFNVSYMRHINFFNPTGSFQRFDVIEDAIVIDNDSALVYGSVTDPCNVAMTQARILLAKVNLNTGAFVWHKTEFNGNFLAARMAMKSDEIAIVMHSMSGSIGAQLAFYDRGGNFVNGRTLKYNSTSTSTLLVSGNPTASMPPYPNLSTEFPLFQNIYYLEDDSLFLSGKFHRIDYPGLGGYFDMPFSCRFDKNGFDFCKDQLYQTDHLYGGVGLFVTETTSDCNGSVFPPIWPPSNTLPRVSGTHEFVTITHDVGKTGGSYWRFKELAFVNEGSMCGTVMLTKSTSNASTVAHQNVTNSNPASPDVFDEAEDFDTTGFNDFDCGQQ